MSLAAGTRLGPYEIIDAIGAGGMGEVYQARDTRLNRTVAIKVLPPDLSGDLERKARFEREAHTLAALSNPHICTLYDVGEHDGSAFLVMELLQGDTLAQRLERGALPLPQALEIAIHIAEGLDAAHKRGIVHRDLKPGNVVLTKTGATLLDFGLAKLRGHGEKPALVMQGYAPTEADPLTRAGAIMGTLQYMAPEQIQGKDADARADIWALGAILYEMVAGARPFTGGSAASLMGAILEREPAPLSTILPISPPSLDRVIRRCLAKSPDERWESARDLADNLRWIAQDLALGAPEAAQAAPRPLWRRALPVGALLVAGLVAGAALMSALRPAAEAARRSVVRSLLDVSPAEYVPSAFSTAFAWTPDGRSLVFVGGRGDARQLFVRSLDSGEARPLAGTDKALFPVVSADGQWVAFWADRAIRKVPLAGGPATVMADGVSNVPAGMDWGVTGTLLYDGCSIGSTIWRVRPGGKPEAVTTLQEGELKHLRPRLLPGGTVVVFTVRRREWTWGDEEVVAQNLASGKRTVLLSNATDARYLPPGRLLFMRLGTLFAVPFDPGRLEVKGEPVAVLDGVAQALTDGASEGITGAGQLAVSTAGDLAYIASPLVPFGASRLASVDRTGRVEPLPAPARSYGPAGLSPDGRLLAVPIFGTADVGIWIYDLTRQTLTPLTAPGGEFFWPHWTPDGRRVAFIALQSGIFTLAWQQADLSGRPELLSRERADPSSWSPDGRELAVFNEKDQAIWVLDLKLNLPQLRAVAQAPGSAWPAFSPDGRWLLYTGGSTENQVYLQPYPGPGPRLQVSVDGGADPAWNPNGREIFFLAGTATPGRLRMMSVGVSLDATATLGSPRRLFEVSDAEIVLGGGPLTCYSVAPDGQRFFGNQPVKTDPPPPVTHINLIQNWLAEVKAKVPSGL